MVIYYESKTGNVAKFLKKVQAAAEKRDAQVELIPITAEAVAEKAGHFFTYTTGKGVLPKISKAFVAANAEKLLSVSSSGDMIRHAAEFCGAADRVREEYGTDIFIRIHREGDDDDVTIYLDKILK